MSDSTILVKYQTKKFYCSCCNQKLPEPKISHVKKLHIGKDDALCWTDWDNAAEDPEDMDSLVKEFVIETIFFFAEDEFVHVLVEDEEVIKVKEFLLQNVIGKEATLG